MNPLTVYLRVVGSLMNHSNVCYENLFGLGAVGLAVEAGEVLQHHRNVQFHDEALDRDAAILELGDAFWYLTAAAVGLGVTLEEVAARNVHKLVNRRVERSKHVPCYASEFVSLFHPDGSLK